MDGATRPAGTRLARWAAGLAMLTVCGANLGCSRVNSFLRDEPPMLGAIDSPKPTGAKNPSAATAARTAADPDRVATTRTAPVNDRYTESFNRTRPRPAPSAPDHDQAPSDDASPAPTAAPAENGVQTTAHDALTDPGNSQGVLLGSPVPVHPEPAATPANGDPPAAEPEASRAAPETAQSVVATALARLASLDSYQVEINRQERVGILLQAPEDVLLSIRRKPRAVRLEWRDGPHQGREVIYGEQETGGMLQVNMADSKIPMPRLSLPSDSPLALSNSRHPITDAGFDTIVGNLQKTIDENRSGDLTHGRIAYTGLEPVESFDHPCHKIVRVLPSGETWQVFFDPETKLPVLVQANEAGGALIERYAFRGVRPDPAELATTDAFDPDRRWGEAKGLLQRLAGAAQSRGAEPAATR
jgi:hypothetical protein